MISSSITTIPDKTYIRQGEDPKTHFIMKDDIFSCRRQNGSLSLHSSVLRSQASIDDQSVIFPSSAIGDSVFYCGILVVLI